MTARQGRFGVMRKIAVGDRDVLRGGIVIECVEVYQDGPYPTGKWVEIGTLEPRPIELTDAEAQAFWDAITDEREQ